MVKKRRELARIDEMHDLGRRNAETLRRAQGWCKHLKVEMTSAGMLAGMSGLPIGSHDISCVHAKGCLGGMNLPWILPEFVVENCRGCPSHSPNGDTEWGERVIAEHTLARLVSCAGCGRNSTDSWTEELSTKRGKSAPPSQTRCDQKARHSCLATRGTNSERFERKSALGAHILR
jgi:hypothetical protein